MSYEKELADAIEGRDGDDIILGPTDAAICVAALRTAREHDARLMHGPCTAHARLCTDVPTLFYPSMPFDALWHTRGKGKK